jgi:hypothetical protein
LRRGRAERLKVGRAGASCNQCLCKGTSKGDGLPSQFEAGLLATFRFDASPVRSIRTLALALCVLIAAAFFVSLEAYRFKKIEKNGPTKIPPVTATIPAVASSVSAAIQSTFNVWEDLSRTNFSGTFKNKFPASSKWSHFFLFPNSDAPGSLFPQDELILLDRGNDEFIPRYVAIPASLRKDDLYLYEPTGDEYWSSEYSYRGQPAKFRCSFLIHIEPAGGTATRLDIFEYQPEIWVGKRFGFSAHAILPVRFYDIRLVEPTTSDRVELLELIQKSVAAKSR